MEYPKFFNKDDIFIAVMGVTGSGKSTFISRSCGDLPDIIGEGLRSCTTKCEGYSLVYKGKTVHLIDTPGFDDTTKGDIDVLRDIAGWLAFAYKEDVRLSGLVYLHAISETRMKGSHTANLRMFKKLTGLENMKSVVLVSSMWDKTPLEKGKEREAELMTTDEFWGSMIKAKSTPKRFNNDQRSALDIIGYIIDQHHKVVLDLQQEMSVDNKDLDETAAGKEVNIKLNKQKEKYEKALKDKEAEMKDALRDNDMKYAQEVLDAQDLIRKEMERLATNQRELQVNNEKLLKEKEDQLQKTRDEIEKMRLDAQRTGKEHADEVEKMRKASEETTKEMQKNKEKLEASATAFRDDLVDNAAKLVAYMDDYYANLTAEQEKRVKEVEDAVRLRALQNPNPPPYNQAQFNQMANYPPQGYYPPYQQGQDQAMMGAAAGMAGASMFAMIAGGGACTIM